jgi:hypothetical protein
MELERKWQEMTGSKSSGAKRELILEFRILNTVLLSNYML